ncbi:Highly reducing polyketide synthase virA [Paramyrothecium foliicola]|nr:Highly reducing polyketide synthase virA [Paramyrothecium foliicola]
MATFEPVLVVEPENHILREHTKGGIVVSERFAVKEFEGSSNPTGSTSTDDNAICIVGMGGISSPSDLWDLLSNKQSAQSSVPAERFNINGFYHPDGKRAGAINVSGGYFLKEDVRQFDNDFFGINNLEASYMDPQQRKLLEVVYECFENAGVSMEEISGSNTAVYVGNFTVDHAAMQSKDTDYVHRYAATGGGTSIMSNRISHVFNLHGPSFTLDTACSSTIYALHQAVTAIKNGDCDGAIVAGVNLIMSSEQHIGTMKGGFLSPTSACHTFDTSADGYARAEAINAIYIKRLSSAMQKGQKIRAVIRGTAINANGKTPGITLPSAVHQAAVIRKAYQNAGLNFADTDYIECHGTGTPVGDPIEVDGIASCFAARQGAPLMIGSVKTNLGHAEAASGLTSIMKVALAFEHEAIPPTYGVKNLNPKLKLDERNMKVLNAVERWPRALRRASVNSFGYGGANGHVILESLDSYLDRRPPSPNGSIVQLGSSLQEQLLVLPFSAASSWSSKTRRQQISDFIQRCDSTTVEKLSQVCGKHNSKFPFRDFLLVKSGPKPTLVEMAPSDKVAQSALSLPFAFVFTGQGAQYAGMAKELLEQSPAFLARIRELDEVLRTLPLEHAPEWTLEETILEPAATSQVNHVTRSQPLCTAVQIALVDMLRSWGVSPSATIGHSSGEIAAAYAAGMLTATQAILAAYFRGYAVNQLKSRGAMVAAGLSLQHANEMIEEKGLREVRVGCVNSPESVTLSGSVSDIQVLLDELQITGKFARKLETGGRAYHSHMMVQVGDLYEQLVTPYFRASASASSDIKMFSSVGITPEDIGAVDESTNMATYFRKNLEHPVQFSAALKKLLTAGKYHLIELGPHAALKSPIQQIRSSLKLDQSTTPYTATLVRKEDASLALKKTAGTLFTHGHALEWSAINNLPNVLPGPPPDLPAYPWDYSKGMLWSEPRASIETRNRKHVRHELLGTQRVVENGIDWNWRNILRLSEMPWLKDHKLEGTVVLPGAAYVALAIEAISQAQDIKAGIAGGQAISFECQNINISSPLVVHEDADAEAQKTELHTTMSKRKISTANSSAYWHDFAISSWQADQTTLHCTGSIRVTKTALSTPSKGLVLTTNTEGYETWSMVRWYEKAREEGLDFGPTFKSLTSLRTDGSRVRTDSIATTRFEPPSAPTAGTFYALHPITLDACFQAAIMGGTAGAINALRAFVPVFISQCSIQIPNRETAGLGSDNFEIHSRVEKTGFSTRRVDCTLRQPNGTPLIDIQDLRLSLYTGKAKPEASSNPFLERHPTLRVQWKPDILRLHHGAEGQLRDFINTFSAKLSPDMSDSPTQVVLGAVLDLAGHKNPRMRVLELTSGCDCTAKQFLTLLNKDTAFPRCRSWSAGQLDEDGNISIQDEASNIDAFDVVLIPQRSMSAKVWGQSPESVIPLLAKQGILVTRKSQEAISYLTTAGFVTLELPQEILLAVPSQEHVQLRDRTVVIVKPNNSSAIDAFASTLEVHLQQIGDGVKVVITSLDDVDTFELTKDAICISLLELEREFLATVSSQDMDRLRKITNTVENLTWLTGGNMMQAPNPDLTLSNGLSRALMLEQPSLRFTIVDCGAVRHTVSEEASVICQSVVRALTSHHATDDAEFILVNNILHISRFTPDLDLNSLFRRRLEEAEPLKEIRLAEVGPARLSIGQVGMTDTMHFQQISEPTTKPPPGYVDINLKAVGLNAKDIYAMSGRVETKQATTALDFSGVVSAVGPGVTHLQPGDRVVAFAPNYFGTVERVPAGSVHKMLPTEEFTVMPTLMTVYATALHALRDRAHLRAGESVLIHAGAGAFGFAAITMAQSMGAIVYTTCGSQAKRDFLTREMGFPAERIFNSRDASFVEGIKSATGKGVDVIVNSLVGDLMHETWRCMAPFGRFVEIGKRELIDAGKLDMDIFLRNTTFTAFDLSEYFFAEEPYYRKIWDSLTAEVVDLYRAGQIQPPPIVTYDVANIAQAYRYFNNKDRVGKVVISMEHGESRVPVSPAKYTTVFDPKKTYLLVGCLGGLGRSLSRWMMARGARNFVFMGRSGCDKPAAARLVSSLQTAGANVTVVRGDVSTAAHVTEAVAACLAVGPIGGVVQAAMGLSEALFTTMANSAWHVGIQPKWRGTWNLHNALEGHDQGLDFFLMTSSLSGSLGTATESNYCAANGFLDAFAHWRRAQGKPAISLGLGMISEVGYLHENPEIEALLLRKGIQPLNEEELLQIVDFGISGSGGEVDFARGKSLPAEAAHILTGLEPLGVRKLMAQGFDVSNGTMEDARTALLAASILAEKDAQGASKGADIGDLASAAEWIKQIPATAVALFASEADAPSMNEAILRLVKKRFSNLILKAADQIDESKPLPSFGVDSMLAAEFRTWFFNAFKVDVPYLDIVSPQKTLSLLSAFVEQKLQTSWQS